MADIVIQFRGTIYENGYGQIAQKVMRDKSLHAMSKAIYAYLVSFAGQTRTAFPSVELMLDELGMSEDTFYKYRKQLINKGYIAIEQQQRISGKFYNNVYVIEVVPSPKSSGTVNSSPKSSGAVNPGTNNNRSLKKTSSNKINKDNNKEAAVVVQIESYLGKSIKTLKPLLKKWIKEYGADYLVEKAQYVGNMKNIKNIIGVYRAAVVSNYDTALLEMAAASEEMTGKTGDRYEAFYSLFPDA